jgi:hypothetical protein
MRNLSCAHTEGSSRETGAVTQPRLMAHSLPLQDDARMSGFQPLSLGDESKPRKRYPTATDAGDCTPRMLSLPRAPHLQEGFAVSCSLLVDASKQHRNHVNQHGALVVPTRHSANPKVRQTWDITAPLKTCDAFSSDNARMSTINMHHRLVSDDADRVKHAKHMNMIARRAESEARIHEALAARELREQWTTDRHLAGIRKVKSTYLDHAALMSSERAGAAFKGNKYSYLGSFNSK